MDGSPEETATAGAERRESAESISVAPSLRRGVVHAFRHAQLQRLEARVERLRRCLHVAPPIHERGVTLVAVDPHPHPDAGWTSGTTPHRHASSWISVICIVMIVGVVMCVPAVWGRVGRSIALVPSAAESEGISTAREVTELRTLLTSLDERVTMLHRQVLQQGDYLTNQAATVLGVTQHGDTQQTQVTALADALAVLTTQVAHINQQVTTHASHLAEYEQQVATQATQRELVPPQSQHVSRVAAKTSGRSSRPRPPTLELLAPPSAQAGTSAPPWSAPLPAAGAQPPRRSITLPAALGAEGYRAATGTTGGTPP